MRAQPEVLPAAPFFLCSHAAVWVDPSRLTHAIEGQLRSPRELRPRDGVSGLRSRAQRSGSKTPPILRSHLPARVGASVVTRRAKLPRGAAIEEVDYSATIAAYRRDGSLVTRRGFAAPEPPGPFPGSVGEVGALGSINPATNVPKPSQAS